MVQTSRRSRVHFFYGERADLAHHFYLGWEMCNGMSGLNKQLNRFILPKKKAMIIEAKPKNMKAIFSILLCLSFLPFLTSQPLLQWSPNLCSQEKATIRFNFYGMPACDLNKYLLPANLLTDFPLQISALPVVFRRHEQPAFCQLEWAMERKIKVPVRFRLGEVQYVDMLEGKSSFDSWMWTLGTALNFLVEKKGGNPYWD